MKFRKLVLKKWTNFASVEVDIPDRLFLVGPNASGKSNFLDVFRFLREGSGRQIGSAYTLRLIEFANQYWRPAEAAKHADSLRSAIRCLKWLVEASR